MLAVGLMRACPGRRGDRKGEAGRRQNRDRQAEMARMGEVGKMAAW